ncbi:MAG: glycoside hydrolase family 13 protein [Clostridia bacterium]|nr:glycoside hydrolase family 13 protein [Clostridia bacterium]
MINRQALFTDETEYFKTPYEPETGDKVTLTFRTLKNDVFKVYAVINGKLRLMKKKPEKSDNFDFYTLTFTCGEKPVSYFFKLIDEDDEIYYNRLGAVNNNQDEYNFSFVPNQKVPDWAKGRVFYQIYADRFCNGNPLNDVEDNEYYYTGGHSRRIRDWYKIPDTMDVNNFYGGDLQGVECKLQYLKNLGVEAVYFNPLFVSPSNHKYDTQDYDYIDPHLAVIENDFDHRMQGWEKHNGYAPKYIRRVTDKTNLEKSNEYFAYLVDKMHEMGFKVVVDGVFNHCGSFHKWLDREGVYLNKDGYEKGAFQSVDSPYRSYFKFNKPRTADSEYEGWWGYKTLPKLNYEKSAELCEKIYQVGEKWVSAPYNADGWRLDVAADLGHGEKFNHKFWKAFHGRVRKANPEAFIFAEHYGDPEKWLQNGEWDSVMNYDAFMEPVTWFLTGMEKHSASSDYNKLYDGNAFFDAMFKNSARFPRSALDSAINQLSNHDHSRFLTRTNRTVGTLKSMGGEAAGEGVDKRVLYLGVLIQMTWVGSPALYYGDEVGQVGWTDPDCRRTYPWGREDWEVYDMHASAIALRKKIHCLKMGSLMPLDAGNGYIVYARFDKEDCAVVAINCSDKNVSLTVPVWTVIDNRTDTLKLQYAVNADYGALPEYAEVKFGRTFLSLPPKVGCVYVKEFD